MNTTATSTKTMSASETAKKAGLQGGIRQLSKITDQQETKLYRWFKDQPKLFYVVLLGAVMQAEEEERKKENKINENRDKYKNQYDSAYNEGIRLAFEGSNRTVWMQMYDDPGQWVIDGFNDGFNAQKQAESIGESLY